jgi:hypothetical protein
MEQGTVGSLTAMVLASAAKSTNYPFNHNSWKRKVLELPHRCRLAGILMSEDLVVILNNKMTSLNLICFMQTV